MQPITKSSDSSSVTLNEFTSWFGQYLCCTGTVHEIGKSQQSSMCEVAPKRPVIGQRVNLPLGHGQVLEFDQTGEAAVVKVGEDYFMWYIDDNELHKLDFPPSGFENYDLEDSDMAALPLDPWAKVTTPRSQVRCASPSRAVAPDDRDLLWLLNQLSSWKELHNKCCFDEEFDPDAPLLGPCVKYPETLDDRAQYYSDLGLVKGSGLQNVQRAALVLARRWDPEQAEGCKEKFYQILRAYDALVRSVVNEAHETNALNSVTTTSSLQGSTRRQPTSTDSLPEAWPAFAEVSVGQVVALAKRVSGTNGRFCGGETGTARFISEAANEVEIVWLNGSRSSTIWPNDSWYSGHPYTCSDPVGLAAFGLGPVEDSASISKVAFVAFPDSDTSAQASLPLAGSDDDLQRKLTTMMMDDSG